MAFKAKNECPECGSNKLEWNCTHVNRGSAQDGRLNLHEVSTLFYLSCECGETVQTVSGDAVAELLTETLNS